MGATHYSTIQSLTATMTIILMMMMMMLMTTNVIYTQMPLFYGNVLFTHWNKWTNATFRGNEADAKDETAFNYRQARI